MINSQHIFQDEHWTPDIQAAGNWLPTKLYVARLPAIILMLKLLVAPHQVRLLIPKYTMKAYV
jgi:hypothetical protein